MKKPADILSELDQKLGTIPDKKDQVEEIIDFVLIYGDSFGEDITELLEKGVKISKEINFVSGEIICYYNLLFFGGMTQGQMNQKYNHTMPELIAMVDRLKDDKDWYPMALNLLSFFYWFRGEYENGFNTIFEATKLERTSKQNSLAWNNFALAVFYFDTKDFENAKKHYQMCFELFVSKKTEYGRARAANGLASVAIMQNKTSEALPLLEYAAGVYRTLSHYSGLSRTVNDLGLLEKTNKNYSRAIELFKESVELRKEINHLQGLITSYTELGEVYLLSKNYAPALEQLEKGLQLSLEVKSKQKQIRLHKLLYDTYKELNKINLALYHFEKYYEIRSELLSDEATNNIKKIQTKHEKEKSEKEAEIERFKNVELKKANTIIEQKNKDITDSIRYAKRIQISLLPTEKYIERILKRLTEKNN